MRQQTFKHCRSRGPGAILLSLLAITLTLSSSGVFAVPLTELNPAGPVSRQIIDLMSITFGLMLLVLIPVLLLTVWIARRYRYNHPSADYRPDWNASPNIERLLWLIPAVIVLILATLTWHYSQSLSPYRALSTNQPPLQVQVIASRGGWWFIYPQQNLATQNQLVIPVGRQVHLQLTADSRLSSLFIPRLAGQIYAMPGRRTQLYLQADKPGRFHGENTQYNGSRFSDQRFSVRAVDEDHFKQWLRLAQHSDRRLDLAQYRKIEQNGDWRSIRYFADVSDHLFDRIIAAQHAHTDFNQQRNV